MVKKQVVELLAAISRYSEKGFETALSSLEHFRISKKQRYRFSILVNELKNAELMPYKEAIMILVNSLIDSGDRFKQNLGTVIRAEFVGK